MRPKLSVSSSGPGPTKIRATLQKLSRTQVLVGIPGDDTRDDDSPVTNAELAFIHSNGSPLQNIPPRPFIQPAIKQPATKRLIGAEFKAAGSAALQGNEREAREHLERAGMIGANAAKRYVLEGDHLTPNAPSTIAAKGSDRPLVDTNQMVRSVTSVVVEG